MACPVGRNIASRPLARLTRMLCSSSFTELVTGVTRLLYTDRLLHSILTCQRRTATVSLPQSA